MWEKILEGNGAYVILACFIFLGVISKLIVGVSQRRLLSAAKEMGKSGHAFIRLVKAKFEHACMISETVENVEVFVDKYLYEYRIGKIRLHSYRRLEKAAAGMCVLSGLTVAFLEFMKKGMNDRVLQVGAAGIAGAIFVYLVHQMTDETYRLTVIRSYMVDHLENICLPRFEKLYHKELKVMEPKENTKQENAEETEKPDETPTEKAVNIGAEPPEKPKEENIKAGSVPAESTKKAEQEDDVAQEKVIRRILEEFLA